MQNPTGVNPWTGIQSSISPVAAKDRIEFSLPFGLGSWNNILTPLTRLMRILIIFAYGCILLWR